MSTYAALPAPRPDRVRHSTHQAGDFARSAATPRLPMVRKKPVAQGFDAHGTAVAQMAGVRTPAGRSPATN
jgi:hypothetical protein